MSSIEPVTIRCRNGEAVISTFRRRNGEASQEVHFSCGSSVDSNPCRCALVWSSGRISSAVAAAQEAEPAPKMPARQLSS
jgi:hypothetical protein